MTNFRDQFPIFTNNPDLVYLDSASTTQKPKYVIDKTSEYIATSYANVGRGSYDLAEKSDYYYYWCKELIGKQINASSSELFWWYNATHCTNIIAYSLAQSWYLPSWWEIIVSKAEHHSNILIRQELAIRYNLTVRWVWLTSEYTIDMVELQSLVNKKTCLTCLTLCSNVLGIKNNLSQVRKIIWKNSLLFVDWSQAIPNYPVDVQLIDADFMVFSWHKFLAYTWLGVWYIKKSLIKDLKPAIVWWGSIEDINDTEIVYRSSIEKFEAWTPNIIGVVSLYHALTWWEENQWYKELEKIEKELLYYLFEQCPSLSDIITPLTTWVDNRIGIVTFKASNDKVSLRALSDYLNKHQLCVRVWWHCAYPLARYLWLNKETIRLSLYIYNTKSDIDFFVKTVQNSIKEIS